MNILNCISVYFFFAKFNGIYSILTNTFYRNQFTSTNTVLPISTKPMGNTIIKTLKAKNTIKKRD